MTGHGLAKDWVIRPAIDLELKQYILWGYLKRVREHFAERKLFPHLTDLKEHLDELLLLRKLKAEMEERIPGELLGFDPWTGLAKYAGPPEHDLLGTVDAVIEQAIPELQREWHSGSELQQHLSRAVHVEPVGVQPLYLQEGWLLLRTGPEARVYAYAMPVLRYAQNDQLYRSVHTRYVTTFTLGLSMTYEQIRANLVKAHPELPVPATFACEATVPLPHIETFMPLAKQLVYEHITYKG